MDGEFGVSLRLQIQGLQREEEGYTTLPSMLLQDSLALSPVGHMQSHEAVESLSVVGVYEVCQFVQRHIFDADFRFFYQLQIEGDVSRTRIAAPPAALHTADTQSIGASLHQGSETLQR